MLTGLLLQESLKDLAVLERLHITKTETWDATNAAEYQPRVWTAISFEVDDAHADEVIIDLSQMLKSEGWYIDARQADRVIVIFPDQVFNYQRGDQAGKAAAQAYARSIGIPTSQLDWGD